MASPTDSSSLEQILKPCVEWIRTHQEQFWAITGTALGVILVCAFMLQRHQTENDDAWTQLGTAHGFLMEGRMDQAKQALDQWTPKYQRTGAVTYSKFMRADLLYRTSDYVQAAQTYADLVQTGQPDLVRPLALSGLSASQEMAGKLTEAQATTQQFLDKYPDHFLAASMYLNQARLSELSGNASGASALYDRFVILYPQSPWTVFARGRLQALSSAPSHPTTQK